MNYSDIGIIATILILGILFGGDPDLMDAIIKSMTECTV